MKCKKITPAKNVEANEISALVKCADEKFMKVEAFAQKPHRVALPCVASCQVQGYAPSWTLISRYIYIYIYMCVCVCMRVCMSVCMRVCICIYIIFTRLE